MTKPKIEQPKLYRPREIAQLGLIKNSKGDAGTEEGHYNYILEMIRTGKLKAQDYSTSENVSYWLVSEEAIKDFHAGVHDGQEVQGQ